MDNQIRCRVDGHPLAIKDGGGNCVCPPGECRDRPKPKQSRFQACNGPSNTKAHIRNTESNSPLVLCQATAPVQNIKSPVMVDALCLRCLAEMFKKSGMKKGDVLPPEMIGVAEIIF